MRIPIAIGVTGHRDLRQQDIPLLRRTVHTELESNLFLIGYGLLIAVYAAAYFISLRKRKEI